MTHSTPAPVADAVEDDREDFEAWMLTQGYGPKPRICSEGSPCAGEYADQYWHKCWDAWQARGDRARSRFSLLNTLAQHRGFESVTKALASLPLAKNGTRVAEQPLRNLQTWLVCSTIGTALKPSAETVSVWIEALETALAARPSPPTIQQPNSLDSDEGLLSFTGVTRNRGRWQARIQIGSQRISIGTFDSPELAHQAYLAAKSKHHKFNPVARDV